MSQSMDELLGDLVGSIVECDGMPPGRLLMLPGARRVVEVQLPDGRTVERGETLAEYARRCVVLKVDEVAA